MLAQHADKPPRRHVPYVRTARTAPLFQIRIFAIWLVRVARSKDYGEHGRRRVKDVSWTFVRIGRLRECMGSPHFLGGPATANAS